MSFVAKLIGASGIVSIFLGAISPDATWPMYAFLGFCVGLYIAGSELD